MTHGPARSGIALIPPGALDLTGEAVRRRRALQRATLATLEAAGFEEVSPPTFEYEEVFVRAGGAAIVERLIRFLDLDGRALALRYDFTASVARVAATAFADRPLPLRLCYSGKVYRQEPDRGARPREILQVISKAHWLPEASEVFSTRRARADAGQFGVFLGNVAMIIAAKRGG